MKKLLLLLLCATLALSGCTQSTTPAQPSVTEPPAPTADPKKLVQTITDPAFLEQFWEEYIDDVTFTIANGYSSFNSVRDLRSHELVSFLYLKMQRAGETDVTVEINDPEQGKAVGIKTEKLNEYCERFFNETVDFERIDINHTLTDAVYLQNVYTLDRLPDVRYNQIEEFPNAELVSVEEYSDGVYVANMQERTVQEIDEEKDRLLRKITLKKREDGSFYFVSASYDFTPSNYVTLEGSYRKLPYHQQYANGSIYAVADTFLTISRLNNEVRFSTFDTKTASFKKSLTLDYSKITNNAFEKMVGGNLLFWLEDILYIIEPDLSAEPKTIPLALQEDVVLNDISGELSLAAISTEEGIRLLDLASGEKIAIPDTALYYEQPDSIMTVHGFGGATFVDGGKQLLYTEGGYEGFFGFWLYDLATKEKTKFAYSGGYGSTILTLDNGIYLTDVFDQDNRQVSVFIDFASKNITALSQEQTESLYWQNSPPNGDFAMSIKTKIGPKSPYETTEIFIRNATTAKTLPTGCKIIAPAGSVHPLAITDDGKGFVLVSHMGERFVLEVSVSEGA